MLLFWPPDDHATTVAVIVMPSLNPRPRRPQRLHITPVDDLGPPHIESGQTCWCRPTLRHNMRGTMVVHNAADHRELWEPGAGLNWPWWRLWGARAVWWPVWVWNQRVRRPRLSRLRGRLESIIKISLESTEETRRRRGGDEDDSGGGGGNSDDFAP